MVHGASMSTSCFGQGDEPACRAWRVVGRRLVTPPGTVVAELDGHRRWRSAAGGVLPEGLPGHRVTGCGTRRSRSRARSTSAPSRTGVRPRPPPAAPPGARPSGARPPTGSESATTGVVPRAMTRTAGTPTTRDPIALASVGGALARLRGGGVETFHFGGTGLPHSAPAGATRVWPRTKGLSRLVFGGGRCPVGAPSWRWRRSLGGGSAGSATVHCGLTVGIGHDTHCPVHWAGWLYTFVGDMHKLPIVGAEEPQSSAVSKPWANHVGEVPADGALR